MNTARLYAATMAALWEGHTGDAPIEAKALATLVHSHHKRNHENALDVLDLLWPGAEVSVRLPTDVPEHKETCRAIFDVTFADGSTALVVSDKGIGNGVEPIGDAKQMEQATFQLSFRGGIDYADWVKRCGARLVTLAPDGLLTIEGPASAVNTFEKDIGWKAASRTALH